MAESAKLVTKAPETKQEKATAKIRKPQPSQSMHSPIDHILSLQRTIGNQAVQRMMQSGAIQAKLKIGQPNDKYEQGADRFAAQVMRMPESQERARPGEEKQEELQTKPLAAQVTPLIQRQPESEKEEEEAERAQPKLESNAEYPLQRQTEEEEEEEESPQASDQSQRQAEEPEKEEEEKEPVQTKQAGGQTPQGGRGLETQIHSLKSGGQPLSKAERSFMESRFGADFSEVRIHTDSNAAQMSRALNAQAFTHGRDIYFGAGKHSPSISSGKRLLAHELTHVLQQNSEVSCNKKPKSWELGNLHARQAHGISKSIMHSSPSLSIQRQAAITSFRRRVKFYKNVTGSKYFGHLLKGRQVMILTARTGKGLYRVRKRSDRFRVRIKSGHFREKDGYIRVRDLIIPRETTIKSRMNWTGVRLVFFQNPERIGRTVLTIKVGLTRRGTPLLQTTDTGKGRQIKPIAFIKPNRPVYLYKPHPAGYFHVEVSRRSLSHLRVAERKRSKPLYYGYVRRDHIRSDIFKRRAERDYFRRVAIKYARKKPTIYVDPHSQKCINQRYPIEYTSGKDYSNEHSRCA